jgi:predicted amidohydrolase
MLIKIVAVQAQMGKRLAMPDMIQIFKQRPDFVCLPEYWLLDDSVTDFHRAALNYQEYLHYLGHLSEELDTCLVGGTVVEAVLDKLHNVCTVFHSGWLLGRYRKRYPVDGERARGIEPGKDNLVLERDGIRFGIMVCGDVFYPAMFEDMRREEVDIIFVPTTSPYRPDDTIPSKLERDRRYFIDGARTAGAYVVKTCGVGTIFGRPLQGRSLIAAPWGVLNRIEFDQESNERIMTATLDIDEIREFRRRMQQTAQT